MKNWYFLVLSLVIIMSCEKNTTTETPTKSFTLSGTVLDDETGQPISNVLMYLYHGKHTCCIGPNASFATLDSVKTDANGKYALLVKRPVDTSINYAYVYDNVRFASYNPFAVISTSLPSGFPVTYDWKDKKNGNEMPVDFKITADYRVIKAAYLNLTYKFAQAPQGDSLRVELKNGVPRTEVSELITILNTTNGRLGIKSLPIPFGKQTIVTSTFTLNGNKVVRRDTLKNIVLGETREFVIQY